MYNSLELKSRERIIEMLNLESSFMRIQNLQHTETEPNYYLFAVAIHANDTLALLAKARIAELDESDFLFKENNVIQNKSYKHIESAKIEIENSNSKIKKGEQVLSSWALKNRVFFSKNVEAEIIFDQAIDSFQKSFDIESSINKTLTIVIEEFPSDKHLDQAQIIIESLTQQRTDLALMRNQLVSKFFK